MHSQYANLLPALKRRLPAEELDALGHATTFVRRMRLIRAASFVWAIVLSRFGAGAPGFEQARQWYCRLTGKSLAPRPFQLRFKTDRAVRLLSEAFERAVAGWRQPRPIHHPLARYFPDIFLWDATPVQVHDSLRKFFKGLAGAAAQVKIYLGISAFGLVPLSARVVSGHHNDLRQGPPLHLLQPGSLVLFDKGFVTYDRLREIANKGLKYLCPMRIHAHARVVGVRQGPARVSKALRLSPDGVSLRDLLPRGKRIGMSWDLDVWVKPAMKGVDLSPVPTRLVIVRGHNGWQRPYLTNLGPEWSPAAVCELYRLRWQIELVFKELKQNLNLATVPTRDPKAALVMVWSSLIALAISRTLTAALVPLAKLTGLRAPLRPAVVSRVLASAGQLLCSALTATRRNAPAFLRALAHAIFIEARQRAPDRTDSFARLTQLMPCT